MGNGKTRVFGALAALALIVTGCGSSSDGDDAAADAGGAVVEAESASHRADAANQASRAPQVVDIVVTGHSIELPESIPSGWTTFRFRNASPETHFGLIDLLPQGKTAEDSIAEVVPVFQDAMDLINAGDPERGFQEFGNLPAWAADIVYMGGPGFVAPGGTAETTVFLEPGTYAMECYLKANGIFHTTHGMIEGFTVNDDESGAPEPVADVEVTLSSDATTGSMDIAGDFRPGKQTIAVHFADQVVHGNVLGHDLHVARIDQDTDLDALGTWMSWITGLETPAPVEFLGGTHDMPAGSTAYVHVTLTPGTYALIAEVDGPADKGLLEIVTVPEQHGSR